MRGRRAGILFLVVAAMLAMLPAVRSAASITSPFTMRFEADTNGAILLRGNASMTCLTQGSGCASSRNGNGSSVTEALNNNGHVMGYTDADGDPATFNDSHATITMPPGSAVLFAGLYWGADPSAGTGGLPAPSPADKNKVLFQTPAGPAWDPVTASSFYPISTTGAYQGFADVTALVASAGNGIYSVANIQAGTGMDGYAGWALAVAYQNATEGMRSLRVYDGFGWIASGGGDLIIPVTGLETPPSGAVRAQVGAVAYEGDLGKSGDGLRVDGQPLSNPVNPANNVFNSTASDGGAMVGGRDPAYRNLLGVDIDQFDATGLLGNGATQATLTMTSAGETYYPGVITFSIDQYAPKVTTTLTGTDVNGGDLLPGDEIEYRITVRNDGPDTADNLVLSDSFPVQTTYVPGSLAVAGSPVTDAAGDDRGQAGGGAATFTLDSLPHLGTNEVTFRVRVALNTPAGFSISNLVNVAYTGRSTGAGTSGVGGTVAATVQQPRADLAAGLAVSPAVVQLAAAPNAVAYTATVTNNGTDLEPAATAELTLPAGVWPGTLPVGCSATGPVVTCELGPLATGSSATVTVPVVADVGTVTGAAAGLRVAGDGRDTVGGNNTASVALAVNSPPTAVADAAVTTHGTPVTVPVVVNDSDPDDPSAVLTVTVGTPPAHGTAVVEANKTIRYTPAPGWAGADTLVYRIDDGMGGTGTATVTITTANAPPIANDDITGTPPSTAVTLAVLANDTDPNGDPLTLTGVDPVAPAVGVVTPNGNQIEFQPDPSFTGRADITYTVADGRGGQATGRAYVDVANAAPTAADDQAATPYLTDVWIDVRANDTDPNPGTTLTVTAVGPPADGTATVSGGGILYQPAAGFSGTVTFTYTIIDGFTPSTATVTVTVGNAAPVALDRVAATVYGTPVTIDVLAVTSDQNPGDTLRVAGTTDPGNGTLTRNPDGTLTYTPDARFSGTDSFDYTVDDGRGGSDTARVTVTVANGVPVARDDSVTAMIDVPLVIDVLVNDDDPNGDPLTVTIGPGPAHGVAAVGPDRRITYTPAAGFQATDAFGYTIDDGRGGTSAATVTVTAVNVAPVARPDNVTTDTDTATTVDVLANDADPNGDALTLVGTTTPGNGTLVRNPDDTLTYTPAAGFYGIDAFGYTVADLPQRLSTSAIVTIAVRNAAPVAEADVFLVQPDVPTPLTVLANDHDPNTGQPLHVASAGAAGKGTTGPITDTTVTYRAAPGSTGQDTFTYVLADSAGGTDTGMVTVTINGPPQPGADSTSTSAATPVDIPVLANDTDPEAEALTVVAVTAPRRGTARITPGGTVIYRPRAGFAGVDDFWYTVRDTVGNTATGRVTVRVAAAAPVVTGTPEPSLAVPDRAVVAEPGQTIRITLPATATNGRPVGGRAVGKPAYGTAVLNADGTVTYVPGPGFAGQDGFTYEVVDADGNVAMATITVTVPGSPSQPIPSSAPSPPAPTTAPSPSAPPSVPTPPSVPAAPSRNRAPAARDDRVTVVAGDTVVLRPLDNDRDPDGDPIAVHKIQKPRRGTATAGAEGAVVYAPDPAQHGGTDAFAYTIRDGRGGTGTATVIVRVVAARHMPATGRNVLAVASAGAILTVAGGLLFGVAVRGAPGGAAAPRRHPRAGA